MSKILNPYEIDLTQSGNPNLIYARSTDGFTTYAVYFASPTEVTCTCQGFERGYNCKHRKSAMFRFSFVPVVDETLDSETWTAILNRIEDAACREAATALFESDEVAA